MTSKRDRIRKEELSEQRKKVVNMAHEIFQPEDVITHGQAMRRLQYRYTVEPHVAKEALYQMLSYGVVVEPEEGLLKLA